MTDTEKALHETFRTINPDHAQQIREAYYKAMEGLQALADTLELADARQAQTAGPLLDEHFIAIEAMNAMQKSELGRVM